MDTIITATSVLLFLLTPLREGRRDEQAGRRQPAAISTHAPAGGATETEMVEKSKIIVISTHAPAGGATAHAGAHFRARADFFSRPCGRGDTWTGKGFHRSAISTHAPAGGATRSALYAETGAYTISTHAPAGGATAIFHKSVMRFCGKLPKDDTVLCLASFGFPRRDPKAVYLAWISCANLPQKCVRQGLALKDQGTSCFHEGLASHAFDPVLV